MKQSGALKAIGTTGLRIVTADRAAVAGHGRHRGGVLFIVAVASLLSIRRVLTLEPAVVFRG